MTQQIRLRRDTAANWTLANPYLGPCEIAFETDRLGSGSGNFTGIYNGGVRFKIGDSITSWSALPYSSVITDGTYAGASNPAVGPVVSFGSGVPVNASGNAGDIYINANGGVSGQSTIYQKRAATNTWVSVV